jgi:type III secretory pathway component EscV
VLPDRLEEISPASVRQVIPKPVSLTLLADILRRLVENVSIRDLRAISCSPRSLMPTGRAQSPNTCEPSFVARLSSAHAREPELEVVLIDGLIEDTVRSAVSRTAAGSFLTLAAAARRREFHPTRCQRT